MGQQIILFGLYAVVIVACFLLAILSRERPTVQALTMPFASLAMYAFVRRAIIWTTGDTTALLHPLVLIGVWGWAAAWALWALVITVLGYQGKRFIAPDGQWWQLFERRINGRRVRQSVPIDTKRVGVWR